MIAALEKNFPATLPALKDQNQNAANCAKNQNKSSSNSGNPWRARPGTPRAHRGGHRRSPDPPLLVHLELEPTRNKRKKKIAR
ncbi:hypothetical protein CEXT_336041 [Caerostris extrusa]|uniref:Uncharacterized protein n=1 Tax=Caerostris extrusa TaxID=172846 RepID=A0AAV4SB28_CAEEX|nr:hypothetical protein CEXT_336041 [Caerostris extrusa]